MKTSCTHSRQYAFKSLPVILLPRVLHRDEESKGGYRLLDYALDILGKLGWKLAAALEMELSGTELPLWE